MRNRWLFAAGCLLAASFPADLAGQNTSQGTDDGTRVCECGAHPPAPPKDRVVEPYAGESADLSPYAKFASPYDRNYTHPTLVRRVTFPIPKTSPKCASVSSGPLSTTRK
jgi:hypothetical protein